MRISIFALFLLNKECLAQTIWDVVSNSSVHLDNSPQTGISSMLSRKAANECNSGKLLGTEIISLLR